MRTLVLTEAGAELAAEGDVFLVRRGAATARRVRAQDVGQIVLMGPIEATSGAIFSCLRRGIDLVYLTGAGRYRGRIAGPGSRNAPLRLAQFRAATDPAASLAIAKAIVAGKVANQRNLLLRAQRNLRDDEIAAAAAAMRLLVPKIEAAETRDSLMGLEGQAAALYFGVFGRMIRNRDFSFARRVRRPPTDPVNACLSFGYTLLGVTVESAVLKAGFDPLLGFFHEAQYGRPSLVLDLIEELRPVVVDHLVLRLLNRRQLAPGDFEAPDASDDEDPFAAPEDEAEAAPADAGPQAVHLAAWGRRVFLAAFFRRLREAVFYPPRAGAYELRQIAEQQVYHMARVVEGREPAYVPFVPR